MINWLILHFAAACSPGAGGILNFPTWYEYLQGNNSTDNGCITQINSLSDIWLIVAAVIEILLRIAALAAVLFVVIGGVKYMTSQGEPDATNKARATIINALIGLLITIVASVVVNFVAESIH